MVKNLPANTRLIRDTGSVPGLGRSPGGGKWQPCPVLTEELGGHQSIGLQRVKCDFETEHAAHAT